MMGLDFESSIGIATFSLGNVEPAPGEFEPTSNFYGLPEIGN